MMGEQHNHLYNHPDDRQKASNVFAPAGGRVIAHGKVDGQFLTSVYYKELGGIKDVVLQYSHVENFTGGKVQKNGSILLGKMGKDGAYTYGDRTQTKGWHIHLTAFKWWKNKSEIPNRLLPTAISPPGDRYNKNNELIQDGSKLRAPYILRLSDVFSCPKTNLLQ